MRKCTSQKLPARAAAKVLCLSVFRNFPFVKITVSCFFTVCTRLCSKKRRKTVSVVSVGVGSSDLLLLAVQSLVAHGVGEPSSGCDARDDYGKH